jgi:serine/threonine-protein kinase
MPETLPCTTPTVAAPTLQVPGYEILGELGHGGMGEVFRGRDPELGRELAVKILREDCLDEPRTVQRFVEEAQIGGQLQHPGVVPIYEAGRLPDQRPYFTMKLVEGRTLAALLKERKGPADDLPRFLKIFEQICQTLAYAHSKGVIHRDLKPLNVMVGAFGEVQVMDWGLAKVLGGGVRTVRTEAPEARSASGSVLGTPAYMAPEQACGDVEGLDTRCDVFGLGAILCEVLTGAPAYRGQGMSELLRQAARGDTADAFARLDACGAEAELIALAKTCLAAEPSDRPADARVVAEAMTAHLAAVQERVRQAELAKAAAQAKAAEERKRRRLTLALAATVLLALTAGGATAFWVQQDRATRAAADARQAAARAAKAAATERDVAAALEDATVLRGQALGLHNNPAKWNATLTEALLAVKQAQGLLDSGEGGDDLRGRVAALRSELEDADRDRRMIARLEEARFQESAVGQENGFDDAGAAALYAKAFREDDPDWDSLDTATAAAHVVVRAIREDLSAALEDWANYTPNQRDRERIRAILQAADPDPASFRNRWNAAAKQKDVDGLRRLAAAAEAQEQPAVRLVDFARTLVQLGAAPEAVKLLKEANERHPGDFWIVFELAFACESTKPTATDEAIRYYTAALMARPDSPVAHSNLGNALYDKHRLDDAIAEYHKALQIQSDYALAHNNLGTAL